MCYRWLRGGVAYYWVCYRWLRGKAMGPITDGATAGWSGDRPTVVTVITTGYHKP